MHCVSKTPHNALHGPVQDVKFFISCLIVILLFEKISLTTFCAFKSVFEVEDPTVPRP